LKSLGAIVDIKLRYEIIDINRKTDNIMAIKLVMGSNIFNRVSAMLCTCGPQAMTEDEITRVSEGY